MKMAKTSEKEGKNLSFPEGFLWGAAVSSHQNEGWNENNDFWGWEQTPGHISDGSTSGAACGWWKFAEDDFDLAAELGGNTLRLSVEWSRVQPAPDRWDDAAIDRYREMLKALRERGLEPMVTLHHFTNPLWLAEVGGWANPNVVGLFETYAAHVVESLGDLCSTWCTINEPVVYAINAYLRGAWPPGKKSLPKTFTVMGNMAKAHALAYRVIHRRHGSMKVGIVKAMPIFDPANPESGGDSRVAAATDAVFNSRFLEAVTEGKFRAPLFNVSGFKLGPGVGLYTYGVDSNDFFGLNYYGRENIAFSASRPDSAFGHSVLLEGREYCDEPWGSREIYPEGIYRQLVRLGAHRKPVYVTENGIDDRQDSRRARFILLHLAQVHRAIREGVDVRGYYHWTLVDNYEWAEGWGPRFGLVAFDVASRERSPRRSALMYAEICRANAITEEIVEKYAPEAAPEIW